MAQAGTEASHELGQVMPVRPIVLARLVAARQKLRQLPPGRMANDVSNMISAIADAANDDDGSNDSLQTIAANVIDRLGP
jgi:hypothetical protein